VSADHDDQLVTADIFPLAEAIGEVQRRLPSSARTPVPRRNGSPAHSRAARNSARGRTVAE
jgi:hypothetical protein